MCNTGSFSSESKANGEETMHIEYICMEPPPEQVPNTIYI